LVNILETQEHLVVILCLAALHRLAADKVQGITITIQRQAVQVAAAAAHRSLHTEVVVVVAQAVPVLIAAQLPIQAMHLPYRVHPDKGIMVVTDTTTVADLAEQAALVHH
jgi:hypothetical protein